MGVETVRGFHAYFHFSGDAARPEQRARQRPREMRSARQVTPSAIDRQHQIRVMFVFRGRRADCASAIGRSAHFSIRPLPSGRIPTIAAVTYAAAAINDCIIGSSPDG
jgi:hypothetical protein